MAKKERLRFSPCSIKQKLILQDVTTDVILIGGGAGKICPYK